MYIQITTQCNMSCEHCCFSCKKELKGEHMDRATFFQAVAFAESYGGYITLGGGEPTIHPNFWEYFGIAMGSNIDGVWMATNGKIKRIAIALAGLAVGGEKFSIALSQDIWHDPINPEVVNTFKNLGHEIRSVDERMHISNVGSAYENGLGTHDDCACPGWHIDPDGAIKMCGCPNSLELGHVRDIDDGVLTRSQEIGQERGDGRCECGSGLDQEQIDYIIDDIEIEEQEAA